MFDNVMIGLDGREGGRDAVLGARTLASAHATLTLAHVYPGHSVIGRGTGAIYLADERARARGLLARARTEAGDGPETAMIASASVGKGLHHLVGRQSADLLVVGVTRRNGIGRALIGDDTWGALNGAPCPVAVVPAGYARDGHTVRRVGVGYDGSPESRHALDVARELATDLHAELSVTMVVSPPVSGYVHGYGMVEPLAAQFETARLQLEAAERQVRALSPGGIDGHAVAGDPGHALAAFSGSVDLLVIGSRSEGAWGRLIHGSTTHRLARQVQCPMLVLTRRSRDPDTVRAGAERLAALTTSV